MSEEIKKRARAATARILGTLPGCTTCVEAADTITRLTRERDEARQRATAAEARVREVEEARRAALEEAARIADEAGYEFDMSGREEQATGAMRVAYRLRAMTKKENE